MFIRTSVYSNMIFFPRNPLFPQINLYSLWLFWSYTMVLLAALETSYNCLILAIDLIIHFCAFFNDCHLIYKKLTRCLVEQWVPVVGHIFIFLRLFLLSIIQRSTNHVMLLWMLTIHRNHLNVHTVNVHVCVFIHLHTSASQKLWS